MTPPQARQPTGQPTGQPTNWPAIKAAFDACAALTPAERIAVLHAAQLGGQLDAQGLAEVRSLLAHHDSATGTQGFLAAGAAQQLAADGTATFYADLDVPTPEHAAMAGQRLGAWQVLRAVGIGGMGEVFEARRADGSYEGRAAIKLLKRGMDSAAVLQRFALERQALARLSHPHIARLLDAGASPAGLPYFVLEFVDGKPIDEAVRGQPLLHRLGLFLQLAGAVAHAHRNLLVHRDLKPGNVLVDSEGQVKLLDFGIAKALDPLEGNQGNHGGSEAGATTVGGVRPYTPNYASPEQIRGEPVSTATDIYSLGVLLYQMLTGTRPTGRKATTPAEAARSVLADMPTRPSRLSAAEAVDPQWLQTRKKLEGDLDNILLKALEKAPEHRYASVDALAADVTAFVEGRPVSARAASPGYVLIKWLRRNRAGALAAGLGGLGLITGLAATLLQGRVVLALGAAGLSAGLVLALVQARRAQMASDEAAHSRDEATRHLGDLRRLANSMVFDVNDALERGLTEGRRQLVDTAAQSLQQQAAHGQMTDAERLDLALALSRLARLEGHQFTPNLGNIPRSLAHYENALRVLQALASRQSNNAAWQAATATAYQGQAVAMRGLRRAAQSLASIKSAAHHAGRAAALAPQDMAYRTLECVTLTQVADFAYPVVRIVGGQQLDAALDHATRALSASQQLVAWAPQQARAQQIRAFSLRLQAGLVAIAQSPAQAVTLELAAMDVLQLTPTLPQGTAIWATDRVPALVRLAITQRAAGDYAGAAATMALALTHANQRLRQDPSDEQIQGQAIACVQTTLDLCVHLGLHAQATEVYDTLMRTLPPLQRADHGHNRLWQHQWMDSLQTLVWVRLGALAEAGRAVQRLHDGLALQNSAAGTGSPNASNGSTNAIAGSLNASTSSLDAELEANVHIATAYLEAAHGHWPAAHQAANAAVERLLTMRQRRDPRDAVEAMRAWQLLVRLAQAPFDGAAGTVTSSPGAAIKAQLVRQARLAQTELVTRGYVDPERQAESLWLAACLPE